MIAMMRGTSGQSTLEYALVMFALLASIAVMGTLAVFLREPSIYRTVIEGSAHVFAGSDALGSVQDLAVF